MIIIISWIFCWLPLIAALLWEHYYFWAAVMWVVTLALSASAESTKSKPFNSSALPGCFNSHPSPQEKAENDCEHCTVFSFCSLNKPPERKL